MSAPVLILKWSILWRSTTASSDWGASEHRVFNQIHGPAVEHRCHRRRVRRLLPRYRLPDRAGLEERRTGLYVRGDPVHYDGCLPVLPNRRLATQESNAAGHHRVSTGGCPVFQRQERLDGSTGTAYVDRCPHSPATGAVHQPPVRPGHPGRTPGGEWPILCDWILVLA